MCGASRFRSIHRKLKITALEIEMSEPENDTEGTALIIVLRSNAIVISIYLGVSHISYILVRSMWTDRVPVCVRNAFGGGGATTKPSPIIVVIIPRSCLLSLSPLTFNWIPRNVQAGRKAYKNSQSAHGPAGIVTKIKTKKNQRKQNVVGLESPKS